MPGRVRQAAKRPVRRRLVLPRAPRGARLRAQLTVERLASLYPAACELDHRNAFELTIATILSAQTTDRTVNLVTPDRGRPGGG